MQFLPLWQWQRMTIAVDVDELRPFKNFSSRHYQPTEQQKRHKTEKLQLKNNEIQRKFNATIAW